MRLILIINFVIIFIDQFIKIYIKTHFYYHENVDILEPWLHITFIENPGMAYGLEFGEGILGKVWLNIIRILLIITMIIYCKKWSNINRNFYFDIASGLIIAGAIGNLIDGLFYGIIFDKGLIYDSYKNQWIPYNGISQLNFKGYSTLFQGVVVDMFRISFFNFYLPKWVPFYGGHHIEFFKYIFNLSDLSITIGTIVVIIFNKNLYAKLKN